MTTLEGTIGFLGAGNMARAILSGMIGAGVIRPEQAAVSDAVAAQCDAVRNMTGAHIAPDNRELVRTADTVVFAVKPFHMEQVCAEIAPATRPGQLFVSICAGITCSFMEERLGTDACVVRVMPNTPALVGCGAAAIAPGRNATADNMAAVRAIFESVGIVVEVPEDKMNLVTGLTGSGPAYLFYFAEALIAAGTEMGLPQGDATRLVTQTILGAARMAMESGRTLAELRQAVTTKGGTTEAGLRELDEADLPQIVRNCVAQAAERSRQLSAGK